MKKIVIIVILMSLAVVWGLEYKAGSGKLVATIERENTASYHTGEDDRHFFYTYPEIIDHRWAVLYDFRDYYDDLDSLLFAPERAQIYLPNPTVNGSLTVGLYQAGSTGPGELITSGTIAQGALQTGWNSLDLNASADTLFWLVVSYPTGLTTDQYISASSGDGSHSYFWDPYYGEEGYWLNMSANGYNNEFLFSLEGEYTFYEPDLEIAEYSIEGEISPLAEVAARAVVHNNFSSTIEDITVVFKKEFPGNIETDTLYIASIAGGESIELPENQPVTYVLNEEPGQYAFSVKLSCEDDASNDNNEEELIYNTFNLPHNTVFLENMVELEDSYSEGIWTAQQAVTDYELLALNYFPSVQDVIYYNPLSTERVFYYQIYNLPATVINGDPYIGYHETNYAEVLAMRCEEETERNSFVDFSEIEGLVDTLENVHVSVTLDRRLNMVLSDYAAECELYGAIYEEGLDFGNGYSGKVFLDTLEFAIPELGGLVNAPVLTRSTTFNQIYKFTPISEDLNNCHLLFWVQNTSDKIIWATAELAFADFGILDDDEDEITEAVSIKAYPNPFCYGSSIEFELADELRSSDTQISIYNIKGQLVKELSTGSRKWNGDNQHDLPAGSGIYFVRVTADNAQMWQKILMVK